MQSTGATIETSYAKDQSLTFVVIGKFWNAMCIKHDSIMNSWTGKQDSVLEAKREILKRFQTQSSTTLDIPKEHHGFILGKAGAKLKELEKQTATKISIPKENEASGKIVIVGPKEGNKWRYLNENGRILNFINVNNNQCFRHLSPNW